MRNITKRYPGVVANDDISLEVAAGSIHGLLGENGAGKSTLVRILFGLVHPDAGSIEVHGSVVEFADAGDALAAGIGMVQQHFSLIDDFTVAENLVLGREPVQPRPPRPAPGRGADPRAVGPLPLPHRPDPAGRRPVGRGPPAGGDHQGALPRRADPRPRRTDGGVGAAGGRGADGRVLERLREQGRTVILISHKLSEVVSRLRPRHRSCATARSSATARSTTPSGQPGGRRDDLVHELARMMVGRELPQPPRRRHDAGSTGPRAAGRHRR